MHAWWVVGDWGHLLRFVKTFSLQLELILLPASHNQRWLPCLSGGVTQSGKSYTTLRISSRTKFHSPKVMPCWGEHHLLAASPSPGQAPFPQSCCLHCPNTWLTPTSCLKACWGNQLRQVPHTVLAHRICSDNAFHYIFSIACLVSEGHKNKRLD